MTNTRAVEERVGSAEDVARIVVVAPGVAPAVNWPVIGWIEPGPETTLQVTAGFQVPETVAENDRDWPGPIRANPGSILTATMEALTVSEPSNRASPITKSPDPICPLPFRSKYRASQTSYEPNGAL